MKAAPKLIFLFDDPSSVTSSIADALHPNPSSSLRRLEESFELSLEPYGIADRKASGSLVHFVDDKGLFQVTVVLLQKYEPPVLACAVNEVLEQITSETRSVIPTFVAPFIVTSSKLKWERTLPTTNSGRASLYSKHSGPETDICRALVTKTQELPSSLHMHYEPLACFLQLVRVLNLPTVLLIGQKGERLSGKASEEELQLLYELGELLASSFSLCFLRDWIKHNPPVTSKESEEPWRALYG